MVGKDMGEVGLEIRGLKLSLAVRLGPDIVPQLIFHNIHLRKQLLNSQYSTAYKLCLLDLQTCGLLAVKMRYEQRGDEDLGLEH